MSILPEKFPEDKGRLNGSCNRSCCLQPGANWFNHSTMKHYCRECATLINRANPEFVQESGHPICTIVQST